ncbi:hypothetical protein [Streptomyces sp. NBC_00038]|uniref:hypothetical protein n=1 Tax=Streptomyces sp. NBC_00038 TaxID=2903615 RepID=UPI0022552BA7|nr:hypothetical protein [Streptomyces sp. NBC_00038]MCX5554521.1 hypothetical protein [Streptomyces sp. NBC_00038]
MPGVIEQATEICRAFVASRVADGDPVYTQTLAERGGWGRWDRIQNWLVAQHEAFTAALLDDQPGDQERSAGKSRPSVP